MFSKSSWLHLRIPFSFFLLPIFFFSLCVSPNFNEPRILWVLIIVHLFLYPASNGYNSYFDKDEKSIGGLKNPPPTKKGLYYLSLVFDAIAIVLSILKLNITFTVMLIIYGLVSKAYSHPATRLKKHAITSLLITGLFQGLFTFMMCYSGLNNFGIENMLHQSVLLPGLLTTFMLWANYPLTQVYQHEEDSKRGDITISIKLGVKKTFYFAASMFSFAVAGFIFYLASYFGDHYMKVYLLALAPILTYFTFWFLKVIRSESNANYGYTMGLNYISATCLNAFFIYLFLYSSNVIQLFQ
jgi:4-hydroxybenzoate polyprenyltransferase